VLSQMRSLAKYVWVLVALAFVGGFLLYETSGLIGRSQVTPTTAVAVVNGHEILYQTYLNRVQSETQTEQQRDGRSLSEDDNRRIENDVFDQMVTDILLQQEYARRGIGVTDEELREFAQYAPPPWITSAPELQTDGQFDADKYRRLLASPEAREGGLLVSLEQYYRSEIPREKLFDQVASGVYVTDAELWRSWRDQHDSAQVSFVAFSPVTDSVPAGAISDNDLRAYFDQHKSEFGGPGQAAMTVLVIRRHITAADTAAARQRALSLRDQIEKGAKFEDIAKTASADTASGANGGDLGTGGRGRFVPAFETAAYALKVGEISQPVLTQFGFHLIRLDKRKGDTLSLHHILIPIQPSDSESARMDRKADQLAKLAASSEDGTKLDTAARDLGLPKLHVDAIENQPAILNGQMIPSVSAWAFGGATVGETSELFQDDNGYYLARLDTLHQGGTPSFDDVKNEVRQRLATARAIDNLVTVAQQFAQTAAGTSLEAAAQKAHKQVQHSPMFNRASLVPGLGQFTQPIGAAFALPVGAVSAPIKTDAGVYVERVDRRALADSTVWLAQKAQQRTARLQQLRQQKVQNFLQDIRSAAKIDDRRKQINAATRHAEA
jgi:peptidyl-prolyl cis-trans isomerase D